MQPMPRKQRTVASRRDKVFTLDEAARFLRLPEQSVEQHAALGEIPGRRIDDTWRFSRTALETWLGQASGRDILLQQAGALAQDPYLSQLREDVYRARGRAESSTSGAT